MPLVAKIAVLSLAVGVALPSQRPPSCAVGPGTFISDSGVGKLRIGLTDAAVLRICHVIADTMITNDDYVEMERVLFVDMGCDTVIAALGADSTIDRIDVRSPVLRTRDGLRVGLRLRDLLRSRAATAGIGEASVFLHLPSHCGLAFTLSDGEGVQGEEFTYDQIRRWNPDIRVTRIAIRGCRT